MVVVEHFGGLLHASESGHTEEERPRKGESRFS